MLKRLKKLFSRAKKANSKDTQWKKNSDYKGSESEGEIENHMRDFLAGNQPNSILTSEGLTIVVVQGSIADQTVDAIVNSIGADFDLTKGALSSSILQAAGDEIQEELFMVDRSDLSYGDVIVTKGYYLSAGHVFHGVLKEWGAEGDDAEDGLRSFVESCFLEANRRQLTSIAFPAIGTGVLGFPRNVVVDCLFNEADKFSASNPDTAVSEIRFVIYDSDHKTFEAFQEKLSQILDYVWIDDNDDDDDDDKAGGEDVVNNFDQSDSDNEPEEEENDVDDIADRSVDIARHLCDLLKELTATHPKFATSGSHDPPSWMPASPGKQYERTKLNSFDREFKMVSKNLMETKGTASIRGIVQIERIENRTLNQLYSVYKMDMEQRNGKEVENERILWHGTVKESLNNICAGGFNRSYCGRNATLYGKGVYFARDFNYSAQKQYSSPDENGLRYAFMCRVLTGSLTVGDQSMIEPSMKPGTDFRHDSTVDDLSSPSIFVIFKDAQAYPEYLVTFH